MAHSPEKKAEAVYDLVNGMTWADAATKHKVSQSTLKDWLDKAKTEVKAKQAPTESEVVLTSTEGRRERFGVALEGFLMATLQMLDAWAIGCADPNFFKDNPSGANELGKTVLERADRMVSLVNGGKPTDSGE